MKCIWGKWFRNIAAALVAVLLTACLAGCSSDEPEKEKTTPTPTPTVVVNVATATPTPTEAPTPTPEEKVKLTMWCALEVNDVYYQPFMEAINELKEKYPNAELELKLIDYYEYWETVMSAGQSKELPDLIYIWGGHQLDIAAEYDMICSLDTAYAPYKDDLQEKMFSALSYNGSKYAIPFNLAAGSFLYANMNILESAGFDEIPKTLDDLYNCCDKLLAKGITPFRVPAKDNWDLSFFLEAMLLKSCGAGELMSICSGASSWDTPLVARAFDTFREMIEKGYIAVDEYDADGDEMTTDAVKNEFVQGNTAFLISYAALACEFYSYMNDRIAAAAFPDFDASAGTSGQLIGAPTDAIAVCNKEGNLSFTEEYAFELAKRVSRNAYLMYEMAPVWNVDYNDVTANAGTKMIGELLQSQDIETLVPEISSFAEGMEYYTFYELLPQLAAGTIDGSEFGKKIEAAE